MEIPLLKDILIIFLISVFIIFVFSKLKIPSIVGFLITGALIGPYGLQALKGIHEVEIMAEVGVILLLFAIGIEFSLESLLRIKKEVMLGGFLQVASTTIISLIFFYFINFSINKSLYFGFIISLSSTAIVLKLFQEKGQVDTPHGKVVLAILIFQDIIAIPMMLVIPLLSNIDSNNSISFLEFIFKVTVILSFLILSTKLIIPKLLYQIIKTKIKETKRDVNIIKKIAVKFNSFDDNYKILPFLLEEKNFRNVIILGMGKYGKLSRILNYYFGFLTYVSVEEKTAEGQLSVEEFEKILKILE